MNKKTSAWIVLVLAIYASWWCNQQKDSYQQDDDMYDDGYQDAIDRKKPKYLDDCDYMDGYKDGKIRR